MNVYEHPRNHAIVATNNTHAIYLPTDPKLGPEPQIPEALHLLESCSPRCFHFNQTLTDIAVSLPSQSCKKADNHEPETPPDPDNSQT